jgi:high-affinity iron transporter
LDNISVSGYIISFREFLEIGIAWIVIAKLLGQKDSIHKKLFLGLLLGTGLTIMLVAVFNQLNIVTKNSQMVTEAVMSLIAALILILILKSILKSQEININNKYIELGFALIVLRELAEVALFAKISAYSNITIILGLITALIFSGIFAFMQTKINPSKILKVLTIILILQIGYLVGYAIHETIHILAPNDSILRVKLYDLSGTMLDTKNFLGAILNGIFGWYHKPEIAMFITQYVITGIALFYYFKKGVKWKINIKS